MCTTYFLVAFHPFILFPASSALISFPLEPTNWKGSEGGRNPGNTWPYSMLHLLGTILEIIGSKEQMQIKIYRSTIVGKPHFRCRISLLLTLQRKG